VTREAEAKKPLIRTSSAELPEHWVQGRGDQGWQWKWQVWLPDKWARIGACETGYGRRPGDWTWNSGTYQGAFGFHHQSWDQFKPVSWWPREAYLASPWQQYRTALATNMTTTSKRGSLTVLSAPCGRSTGEPLGEHATGLSPPDGSGGQGEGGTHHTHPTSDP
jgi:hypothetical protein